MRPENLNVLGNSYAVTWHKKKLPSDKRGHWGLCYKDERKIQIRIHNQEDFNIDTLFHEWAHACLHEFKAPELLTEEQVAEYMGTGMMKLLKENPGLREWLLQIDWSNFNHPS